ncbi:MAG: Na(+)/H(+) antiporter subunit D [Desulfovibrionales bacterium]
MINSMPPSLLLILGAFLIPFLRGNVLKTYVFFLPVVSFINMINLGHGSHFVLPFLEYDLVLAHVDRLSFIFGVIFHIILLLTIIYGFHQEDRVLYFTCCIYGAAAIGVTFAGDMFSLFVFWELLTVTAAILIWKRRTKASQEAGFRYFLVHAAGGLVLLAGFFLRLHETGSLAFDGVIGLEGLSSYLIFIGFGVNCAWPLLHNWLVDAYPESSIVGSVALAAFTTKVAVYTLARAYPGTDVLIWIGAVMAAFPIFYAVIENDLRRVLAYSLINQVGFMVVGIGVGTNMALNGAVAHAFAHILYKGLLFMSMGAVLFRTGRINATALGGLYKSMPLTCLFCIVGAASISAFPLFSGFVSKSMVMDSLVYEKIRIVWFILLFASAGVFHHAGIKIPFFAFFSHDQGIRCKEAPMNMLIAMGITAFLCVFIGCYPYPLYQYLPFPVEYEPYTASHVISQLQLLFFSALAFCLLLLGGVYPAEIRSTNLDFDWFYRKGSGLAYAVADRTFNTINNVADRVIVRGVTPAVNRFFRNAPLRLSLLVLAPFLSEDRRDRFERAFEAGVSPLGISVAAATLSLFAVVLFSLL